MSRDEAEKAVKESNITLKDLEIPALKKQITFRKTGNGFEILFDKKLVGELLDITFLKQEDGTQVGNERTFNLALIDEDGYLDEAFDTIETIKNAKETAKDVVAKNLLRDSTEINFPSLKKIFQNLEYNNQGMPKKAAEESERNRQKLRERNKKAKGGMIDKSLPGRSRYI